jgi:hypothetical protein
VVTAAGQRSAPHDPGRNVTGGASALSAETETQSRLRIGHGAKNMAVIRHFALNLVRQVADKQSMKPPQARQLGSKVPAGDIGPKSILTSTRCPVPCPCIMDRTVSQLCRLA